MAQTIITKHSEVLGKEPAKQDLVRGELAINLANRRLFTKDQNDEIVPLTPNWYEMAICFNGIDADSTIFFRDLPTQMELLTDSGSHATISKPVPGDVTYTMKLDDNVIGTIKFNAGETEGIVDVPSTVSVRGGNIFTITSPETIYEMELMSITLYFKLTFNTF